MAQWNIQSLIPKLDELRQILKPCGKEGHIIGFTETWLKPPEDLNGTADHNINIPGYHLIRNDRKTRAHGGVACYIHESVPFKIRPVLHHDNIESITIEVTLPKSNPFLVTVTYRPPNQQHTWYNDFEQLMDKLCGEDKEMYILGDFNRPESRHGKCPNQMARSD